MVDMTDTPIPHHHSNGWRKVAAAAAAALLLSSLAWGMSGFIHVGEANGLIVQAEFYRFRSVSGHGEYNYSPGGSLDYQIKLQNRGNSSFSNVEVQSSLHSEGGACGGQPTPPGQVMPGNSISPAFRTSLSPGREYNFNASYSAPAGACDSSAYLQVRIQYMHQGSIHSYRFTCPARFRFQ